MTRDTHRNRDIRRYELTLDTNEEEAGTMKAQRRIEEAQRIRQERKEKSDQDHRP